MTNFVGCKTTFVVIKDAIWTKNFIIYNRTKSFISNSLIRYVILTTAHGIPSIHYLKTGGAPILTPLS